MLRKCLIPTLVLLFTSIILYGQAETSNWYFGENAGIKFDHNTVSLIGPLTDGAMSTREGCTSISNANGDLLFYSDGQQVWNKLHNVMPNGSGLNGSFSSTQSAIIVPFVNDVNKYYIFTVDAFINVNIPATGLHYSVVDMTLDSGNGDIIPSEKNILLLNDASEKICAVKKPDNSGYWVITFGFNATNTAINTFYVYDISAAGINTTPISSSTTITGFERRGYLKVSPDGSKIALANTSSGLFLFDFNNVTGTVSNQLQLTIDNTVNDNNINYRAYGAEFSPNSQLLYIHANNDQSNPDAPNADDPLIHFSLLLQFDLTAANIEDSQIVLDDRNMYRGALQLGLDGRIYRTTPVSYNIGSPFLSVINHPDQVGTACNYVHNAISLNGGMAMQGLPPFISSFFDVAIDAENICFGDTTEITIETNDTYESILWDFDDPSTTDNTSTEDNPTHIFSAPGNYIVKASVTHNGATEEYLASITIHENPEANTIDDWIVCTPNSAGNYEFDFTTYDPIVLGTNDPTVFSVSYFHSELDAIADTNPITDPYTTNTIETIYVRVENILNNDCFYTSSFVIDPYILPELNFVTDTLTCINTAEQGTAVTVDLSNKITEAYGSQSTTDFEVDIFNTLTDAENNSNAINPSSYNTTQSNETLYIRITNTLHEDCYSVRSFHLNYGLIPVIQDPEPLISCLDETSGTASFDTSNVESEITNNNQEGLLFFYFEEDGNFLGYDLPNPFESESQTISAIVMNPAPSCFQFDETSFTFNNNAAINIDNNIELTNAINSQHGSVWSNTMIDLTDNFTVETEMYFGNNDNGGDGIAFVLQSESVNAGSAGIGLGYQDISPSLAIEFDTFFNNFDPFTDDHVAIVKNGNADSNTAHSEFAPVYNAGNLEDDSWHPVTITWNAATQLLEVYLDGNQIISANIDITSDVFNNDPFVYWGFTGATTSQNNSQQLNIQQYCASQTNVGCTNNVSITFSAEPPFTLAPMDNLEVCDDNFDGFAEFDTSAIEGIVQSNFDNPDNYIIEYFDENDNPLPSPLPNPMTNGNINLQTITVGVLSTITGCYVTNTFSLIVNPIPEVSPPAPLYACDLDGDGYTTFMLNTKNAEILDGQTGFSVFYYETMEDLEAGNTPLPSNYTNINTPSQTLYVLSTNPATGCFQTTTMEIIVSEPPAANLPSTLYYCDPDSDGFGIFDIESIKNEVIPNDGVSYEVTIHETITDAENNVNEFYSMYENIVPDNQTIYVRVENDLSGCYDIEPLDLIVHHTPIVPVNLDDLEICDDNVADGFAEFDLSLQNPAVFGSQSTTEFTISYHASLTAAENGTGDLPQFYTNIYAYTQTIYVRLENNTTGCYTTREFELIVNPNPVIASDYDHDLALCDDFGEPGDEITVFDLTVENDDITGGVNGYAVSYFHNMTDARNSENQIIPDTAYQNSANAETLYVRVEDVNTGCASYTTVTLRVLNNPSPNANMEPQETCDDDTDGDENNGQAVFDLTFDELALLNGENQVTPVYYESYDDAFNQVNEIADPTNYYNITPYLQTIYVRVTNDATACFTIVDFDLIVHPLPAVNQDNMFYVCELDNDFTETFPLTDMDSFVMDGGDTTDLEISYYNSLNDAENDIAELVGPNITVNGTRDIFARVFDTVNECVQTLAFTIEIRQAPIANKPDNVALCDVLHELADGTIVPMNDGVEIFDLTQVMEQIRGQQDPNTFIVSIYYTQQEAIDMVNPMEADDIIAYETATTTLYAIVTNANTGCINGEPVEINLIVEPLAEVVLTQSGTDILCVDATNNPIIGSDLGAGYTYLWNTGATTPTIEVTEGGEYFVEVINTNTYNQCSFTSNTVVYQEASLPGVTPRVIQSEAFQGEDTIAVIAEGAGVSEYSYELETGEYNTTGIFTNVTPGFHTITITELNGCGSMTIQVSVIDYMRYFTPNGDGVNDNWQIIGLESQQNAQVFIFDRHGKLLKQLSATSKGWNGTYNGAMMPSNDYWFKVVYTEPTSGEVKEYRNHFSLVR